MSAESACCPPGSHGAPPEFHFDEANKPQGIRFELGKTKTPCYYIGPSTTTEEPVNLGIIVYTDVWGFKSRNHIICDYLAKNGNYHVLVMDCFRGETMGDHKHDFVEWLQKTPYDPYVAQDTAVCLDYLKDKGVTKFGALGFCWGAFAIGKSTLAGIPWEVAVSPHPPFKVEKVAFNGDDVALMQSIKCPLLLLPADNDLDYTKPDSPEFQVMKERGGKSILYKDMSHGWLTRGDMSDPLIKRDVESSLVHILEFYLLHLKN